MLEIEKELLDEQLKDASYVASWELGDANNIWQKVVRRKYGKDYSNNENISDEQI